jgi:ParB/RepB/Spo0J family partition protein
MDGERASFFELRYIDVNKIDPNPQQPRAVCTPEELQELAEDIAERGLLQPIVVTPKKELGRFMRIAGQRRHEAVKRILRWPLIPCIIRPYSATPSEAQLLADAMAENIQREPLTDYEEAVAIQTLNELWSTAAGEEIGVRELARRLHKSHSYVSRRLRILQDEDLSAAVRERRLSISAAQELLTADAQTRQELAAHSVNKAEARLAARDVDDFDWGAKPAPRERREESRAPQPTLDENQVLTLREIFERPPEMILDEYGLGELVEQIREAAIGLRVALVKKGQRMDEKCWERLREGAIHIDECFAWHNGKATGKARG